MNPPEVQGQTLDAALAYADYGYMVFPCRASQKRPMTTHGRNDATTDPDQIEAWFADSQANIGLVTDGLVVIDVDEGGYLSEDPEELLSLAGAPVQETPRGRHYVFRQPEGRDYRNSQSRLASHVDTRANGGYVLVAPSIVGSKPYKWLIPLDCSPEDLITPPGWLVERLDKIAGVTQRTQTTQKTQHVSHSEVKEAIDRTLPTTFGTRSRLIFHFARELWAIYGTKDVPPRILEPHVREWHRQALANIRTKPFEETWGDFLGGWQNAKFPAGKEPISAIYTHALKQDLPECAQRYDSLQMRSLVALCRELQREAGNKPFFLDCRTAGRLVGVDRQTANRWLSLVLSADQILERIRKGVRGRGSEYRYLQEL